MVLILALFSASGLGAGTLTRALLHRSGPALSQQTTSTTTSSSATASHQPTATPQPTLTPVQAASGFQLSVENVSPSPVSAGQTLTITVKAVAADGQTPVSALQCSMRAPQDGKAPLYQHWPAPAVTNASGLATWTLKAPDIAPGLYGFDVIGYGADQYYIYVDGSVSIA